MPLGHAAWRFDQRGGHSFGEPSEIDHGQGEAGNSADLSDIQRQMAQIRHEMHEEVRGAVRSAQSLDRLAKHGRESSVDARWGSRQRWATWWFRTEGGRTTAMRRNWRRPSLRGKLEPRRRSRRSRRRSRAEAAFVRALFSLLTPGSHQGRPELRAQPTRAVAGGVSIPRWERTIGNDRANRGTARRRIPKPRFGFEIRRSDAANAGPELIRPRAARGFPANSQLTRTESCSHSREAPQSGNGSHGFPSTRAVKSPKKRGSGWRRPARKRKSGLATWKRWSRRGSETRPGLTLGAALAAGVMIGWLIKRR